MNTFNFAGTSQLNIGDIVTKVDFVKDNQNGNGKWERCSEKYSFHKDDQYKILEIHPKEDGRIKIKMQRITESTNRSGKTYFHKMNLIINKEGQSSIISNSSCKKHYCRYVITK